MSKNSIYESESINMDNNQSTQCSITDDNEWEFITEKDNYLNLKIIENPASQYYSKNCNLLKSNDKMELPQNQIQSDKKSKPKSFSYKLGSILSSWSRISRNIMPNHQFKKSKIDKNSDKKVVNETEILSDDIEIGFEQGKLAAESEYIIAGGIGYSSIDSDTEFQFVNYNQFVLDAYVGSKSRITVTQKSKYWSKQEDIELEIAVRKYKGNWIKIEAHLDKFRTLNSSHKTILDSQKRWKSLQKNIDHNWSKYQDAKLIELVNQKGKHWSVLSKYFDGMYKDRLRKRYEHLQSDKRSQTNEKLENVIETIDQKEHCTNLINQDTQNLARTSNELLNRESINFNCMRLDSNMSSIYSNLDAKNNSQGSQSDFIKFLNLKVGSSGGNCISQNRIGKTGNPYSHYSKNSNWNVIYNEVLLGIDGNPKIQQQYGKLNSAIAELVREDDFQFFTPTTSFLTI